MKKNGLTGGFAIDTISEEEIKANAKEKGLTLSEKDWEAISADCIKIENSAKFYLNLLGIETRSEGHDSQDVLVGTFWCKKMHTRGLKLITDHESQSNVLRFSDHSYNFLENCSEVGKQLLDGSLYFFSVEDFSE